MEDSLVCADPDWTIILIIFNRIMIQARVGFVIGHGRTLCNFGDTHFKETELFVHCRCPTIKHRLSTRRNAQTTPDEKVIT